MSAHVPQFPFSYTVAVDSPPVAGFEGGEMVTRLVFGLLVLSCAIVKSTTADAQSLTNWDPTGNDLVASCSGTLGSYEQGTCLGFIHGVIGGFDMGSSGQQSIENKGRPTVDLCVPNGVSNGQIVKVIMAFADKHPEQLHYPADVIVTKTIAEAWPAQRATEQGHICTNVLMKEKQWRHLSSKPLGERIMKLFLGLLMPGWQRLWNCPSRARLLASLYPEDQRTVWA
jgi:hypothetical protein